MSSPAPKIHVRRMLDPTPEELTAVLRIMRLAFSRSPFFSTVLGGDLAPERVDAFNRCFVGAALLEGEGEVWVAEVDQTDAPGGREIVGEVVWFVPGSEFLGNARQREGAWWTEFSALLGEQQAAWFTDYYLPRMDAFWTRCLPTGPSHMQSYELSKLAVLPEYSAQGVASALVWPVLERAVRAGARVLGETTSERNVQMYRRVGARGVGEESFYPLEALGKEAECEPAFRVWALELTPGQLEVNDHWTKGNKRPDELAPEIIRASL
ncbi:hypothetical protein CALVIDRAFT_526458 [Calocera viscosa TUFC12733]|uniref:N-acetyltransferase domain-containing protein n=1 Tax=Calocera viscosa (strain TUFC12733) TaxID=1330018 RepID=A0A167NGV0_CALVF|nr:hypothetical protein CALVIDRAFT_526458 [Calocera viscosa TUFC12733]